jgi:small subunit ribosomal protein S1
MTPESPDQDSFAALFAQTEKGQPKTQSRPRRDPRVGDTLDACVIQIGRDTVFVELDGKRQAYMDAIELRAADGTMTVSVGDKLTAPVVEVDARSGNVRLGRVVGRPGSTAALEQAKASGLPVEGKVTGINKGGLEVEVGAGARAFCPMSQADTKFVEDPSVFLGKSLHFIVTDVRDGGKSVVVSRRAVLEREARDASSRMLKELQKGTTVRGTVTSVRDFGAFVDLGGIEGLIPVSEISHERGVAASERVKPGDVVDVQVRDIKEVAPQRTGDPAIKITLSLKALAVDPWEQVDAHIAEGKVALGRVTRIVDFGAFVRVAPGIEGLLHASEVGGKSDRSGKSGLATLAVGQEIPVVVKSIDRGAKKVSLVLAPDGAVAGASVKPLALAIGSVVSALVERIETYGVFVQVEGTKGRAGRGLVPNVELGVPRGTDLRKAFPDGTKVLAKVLEVGEGRLRLSVKGAKDDEERSHYEGFSASGAKGMGTFGDLLRKKLSGENEAPSASPAAKTSKKR